MDTTAHVSATPIPLDKKRPEDWHGEEAFPTLQLSQAGASTAGQAPMPPNDNNTTTQVQSREPGADTETTYTTPDQGPQNAELAEEPDAEGEETAGTLNNGHAATIHIVAGVPMVQCTEIANTWKTTSLYRTHEENPHHDTCSGLHDAPASHDNDKRQTGNNNLGNN